MGRRFHGRAGLLPSWDWERSQPALVVTGLNDRGIAVWEQTNQRS